MVESVVQSGVIASEATQSSGREGGEAAMDCRVASLLAMTGSAR
jgi:hypothetical protein